MSDAPFTTTITISSLEAVRQAQAAERRIREQRDALFFAVRDLLDVVYDTERNDETIRAVAQAHSAMKMVLENP